eukprot:TRINITY_DN1340_c0_g3_i2.p1 TRINITY_DN1340_c0_g3~~TRINITY_DN1340_c0_g3_i2.p1  ORF type:complete len:239 (+),score=41.54 TRINITY_DN1340_c0_g3_i2:248-964(+)
MRLICKDYLCSSLSACLKQFNEANKDIEIDPKKVDESLVEQNMVNLTETLDRILNNIYASKDSIPQDARTVFNMLKELTVVRFPGSLKTSVGGFFFLRLLCPTLVTPELADIDASLIVHRRSLIIISKCLQNLVNGVNFSEACMKPLNPWLDQNKETMEAFILSLAELSPSPKAPSLFPKVTVSVELGEAITSFFFPQWDHLLLELKDHPTFQNLAELSELVTVIQAKQKKSQDKEKK